MKKLLISLFVLAVLLVGGTALVANLMPKERIEAEVKARVKEAIGREVEFSKAQLMVWPNPGVRLRQVTIKNPEWAKAEHLLTLDKLEIFFGLKKLLEKKIEVRRFALTKPVVALEVAANGRQSWVLKTSSPAKEKSAAGEAPAALRDFHFTFGQMEVKEGTVSFLDHATQQKKTADQIDISVTYPDLDSTLEVDGALQYDAKKVALVFSVEKPLDLFAGQASKLRARVKAEGMSLELVGASSLKGVLFDGDVTGEYDAVKAKGALKVTHAARPHVTARLSMNKLVIDSFLKTSSKPTEEKITASSGWSEDKIDFSALRALDTDLELKTDGFSWRGVDVGPSVLSVLLKDGNLSFKSSEAALFGGRFTSGATVVAATPARFSFDFEMKGVEAKPLLSNFANFRKLSGTMEGNVRVAATGQSEKEIMSSLNGTGAAMFRNGAFEGIDLVKIARLLQSKSDNVGTAGEGQTEFVELGGTFTVQNGVATNNDLKMIGPLVNATGKGKVDLPQKHVQYRVVPVLLSSADETAPAGLSVPVDITGPFEAIKIRPDFASVIEDVITDPSRAKQSIKNIKGNIKDLKKDLKENPAKALEGLLGGGF